MGSRVERGNRALAAMKDMGFSAHKTKPILKSLLVACENNWEHIEAENYRLLIEAILESEEVEAEDPNRKSSNQNLDSKKREAPASEETGLYRKRHRQRQDEQQPSCSMQSESIQLMKVPKVEKDDSFPGKFSPQRSLIPQSTLRERNETSARTEPVLDNISCGKGNIVPATLPFDRQKKEAAIVATRKGCLNGGPKELSIAAYEKHPSCERVQNLVHFKEPKIEPGLSSEPGAAVSMDRDEPISCEPLPFEVPIAIIRPSPPIRTREEGPVSGQPERWSEKASPNAVAAAMEVTVSLSTQNENRQNEEGCISYVGNKSLANDEVSNAEESSTNTFEITSSTTGEAKVSLLYSVVEYSDFQMPSLESVLKRVEDKCLRSYKILDPSFSIMDIMKEVCTSVLELGTGSVEDKQEDPIRITTTLDALKASGTGKTLSGAFAHSAMVMDGLRCSEQPSAKEKGTNEIGHAMKKKSEVPETPNILALVRQHEPALGAVRPVHDVNDITKGEERVRVSIVNEFTSEQCPPHFSYIPHNVVFQNAYLNFSLARIGDENYCSDCFGDCLSASIPCACARETGGEYAYTLDGLLKKKFLDGCVSMIHDPQKQHFFYCKDCPRERSKNDLGADACKGHLTRRFIKECWTKCGCNKQCGNRVVQRGITCNLQIFFTPDGKGWGLRTLDELPKGSFVCEYVGEVLTNMEFYDRVVRNTGNTRHTHPVLLDADWGPKGMLKAEEALCLDATFYGNVSRFINHRCVDANLVDIPVEVETPDRNYYHLAFFTVRKVEAFEELTWDYIIDFDDNDCPIKAFRCLCGSKLCRDIRRPTRRKLGTIVLR